MWENLKWADHTASEKLGDWRRLIDQIGGGGQTGIADRPQPWAPEQRPSTLRAWRGLLRSYVADRLGPFELPAIAKAFDHARQSRPRELVALDRELGREPQWASFAEASRFLGRVQLEKLRPLRDQRVVQRYLQAVEQGEAAGWHLVVCGLVFALYSVPLRQGLLHYALATLDGFVRSGGRLEEDSAEELKALLDELEPAVLAAIESAMANRSVSPTAL